MQARSLPCFVLPRRLASVILLFLFAGVPGVPSDAGVKQGVPGVPPASSSGRNSHLGDADEPFERQNSSKLEHMREDERRKRLMADTARLVALTNELKTEVDKSSRDELSLDVIRKATEIEKLAHDVRERMKG